MATKNQMEILHNEAKSNIYSWACNDLTYKIAVEVMGIGLAKMISFYKKLGEDPNDVLVVFGPDGSVTRNKERFNSGVGYGCVVVSKKFIFPSLLHPNGCGFGLYHVNEIPKKTELMLRLKKMKQNGVQIGEKKGKWDVYQSNHFIDILRLESQRTEYQNQIPNGFYVLIHSSQQTEKEKLSYWKPEDFITIESSLGNIEALEGVSCKEYLSFFNTIEQYSKDKRSAIARELFGEDKITCISNPTHQGYFQENGNYSMRLGLYNTLDNSGIGNKPLFPIGFNAYSFIYLYEGLPNILPKFWTGEQKDRAESKNHSRILSKINLLPHGGGYKLNLPYSNVTTMNQENEYYFKLSDSPMETQMFIQNIESLEYGYRGPNSVLPLVDEFNLGKRVARFVPIRVIKY
ncbi:MAG: hypothetical protein ACW99F_02630 [Candidatus Hodarchaeales archaeon]|jgi:hypothetical protein